MSEKQLGRLFQPFVQADAATSSRFGGTGLGLVIARRVAELMGGTVESDNELGRRTTVTLPRVQILAEFRQAKELDAVALRRAAGREDFAPVMEFSHRIKGPTLMIGATRLSQACVRIEAAGAARHGADLDQAMGLFETELLRLNSCLETLA